MNKKAALILAILVVIGSALTTLYIVGKQTPQPEGKKVLFYRNPMNPQITSPVPMKDEMGMDYVPVYEKEIGKENKVYISPEKQQLVGIKTGTAERIKLVKKIRAAGRIAYDPELYSAQSEFVQALISSSDEIALSARTRLKLLGMSEGEIDRLAGQGKPDEGLILPGKAVWLYANIFENDIPLIKAGQTVRLTASSIPGKEFSGRITSISPVLDADTRTARIRARIPDPAGSLLPEMFVNAEINADLGNRLAIPREAVLDSGASQLVFIDGGDGYFEPRQIRAGVRTEDYVEVISGIKEGEKIVVSGNFLIDSESRLRSALSGMGEAEKQ